MQDTLRAPFGYRATRSAIGRALVLVALMLASAGLFAASDEVTNEEVMDEDEVMDEATDEATYEAFSALLLMPGAEPESGWWEISWPEGFKLEPGQESGDESEARLIAYLAEKKKAGADFNAYRYSGTLLHHAIRAGFTKTALWLLENGADPNKTVKGDGAHALDLGIRYKRDELARLLQERYGLKTKQIVTVTRSTDKADADPRTLPVDNLSASDIEWARRILERTRQDVLYSRSNPDYPKTHPEIIQKAQERLKQWADFVSRLPPGVYAKLMDDDSALADLIKMYASSAGELDKALADLPPELIGRRAGAALAALASKARRSERNGEYSVLADSWRALWRRAGRPLVYPEGIPFAGKIQPELWPELFASGYADRDAESALGCLVTQLGADDFEALWSRLEAHFPNLRETAPRMVLSRFWRNNCYPETSDEIRKKLLFLTSLGIAGPVKGIFRRRLEGEPADLLAAMKPFLPDAQKTDSASSPRLIRDEPSCGFTLTDDWLLELLNKATRLSAPMDNILVETVQLIDIPGEAECGLVIGGYYLEETNSFDDSFTGPASRPGCAANRPGGYEVIRKRLGKFERLKVDIDDDGAGGAALTPVLDTATGRRYYLRDGGVPPCGSDQNPPELYAWKESPDGLFLGGVTDWELDNALFDQCDDEDRIFCQGIGHIEHSFFGECGLRDNDALYCEDIDLSSETAERTARRAMSYPAFLKTLGAAR
jgi:hypothetical protein